MNDTSLTDRAIKGTLWSFIESFSRQFITFLLGLILARLLFPSDYGLIGMLQFFIAICQSFIDCGFSNALICKKDRTNTDFSTAFYFNLIIGVCSYIVLFVAAPFISIFYNEPQLTLLLRVVGLSVVFNSLCIVQNAILTATLRLKLLTRATLLSQFISGIIGISCAYYGLGAWALAIQTIGANLLTTIFLWHITKWRPMLVFSKDSFHYLWGFGSKMLFVGIISNAYSNMHSLIIGKAFNKSDLGIFSKANSLARLIPNTFYTVLNKVSLPSFTEISDDTFRLKTAFRKYIRLASFCVFPIMGFLFTFAKPLILFLWTDKWIDAIPCFQLICIGSIWNTVNLLSISILQVLHKPNALLKYEMFNKCIGFVILIATLPFGFYAVIVGRSFYNLFEYLSYTTTNKRYLAYKYSEQLIDIIPNFLLMSVCMVIAYIVSIQFEMHIVNLYVGGIVGFSLYFALARLTKMKSYNDMIDIIKLIRKK